METSLSLKKDGSQENGAQNPARTNCPLNEGHEDAAETVVWL